MLYTVNIKSQYMNMYTDVSILLPNKDPEMSPAEFYSQDKKYKVLWLLHGGACDYNDWMHKTKIELYAREHDFIVVMPEVGNTFYTKWSTLDTPTMPGYDSYGYITEELMPYVYGWLPASSDPKDNYIAGLSMGALGAAKFAVNRPELFAGAGVFSANPVNFQTYKDNPLSENIVTQYIHAHGSFEAALASEDNVWDRIVERKDELPPMYVSCGTADPHYAIYLPFKEYAEQNELPIEFSETEGYGHEYRFWDIEIEKIFDFFETH